MKNRITQVLTWLHEWYVRPSEVDVLKQEIAYWNNRKDEESAQLIINKAKSEQLKCRECLQYEAWQEAMEEYKQHVETTF